MVAPSLAGRNLGKFFAHPLHPSVTIKLALHMTGNALSNVRSCGSAWLRNI